MLARAAPTVAAVVDNLLSAVLLLILKDGFPLPGDVVAPTPLLLPLSGKIVSKLEAVIFGVGDGDCVRGYSLLAAPALFEDEPAPPDNGVGVIMVVELSAILGLVEHVW